MSEGTMLTTLPEPGALESAPVEESVGTDGTLVACDPTEMARAQGSLIAWAEKMRAAVGVEADELTKALEIATRNRWGTRTILATQLKRAEKRSVFYSKIADAVRAGYLVVPNFDMDVFAIRTKAKAPRGAWRQWGNSPSQYRQVAGMLPSGEGENVSPLPTLDHWATEVTENGKSRTVHNYKPDEFEDVDFPVEMAKPVVMDITERALRLRLFDEIGIARDSNAGRRGDPMILGRLRNPRANRPDVTFFLAWMFNPSNV